MRYVDREKKIIRNQVITNPLKFVISDLELRSITKIGLQDWFKKNYRLTKYNNCFELIRGGKGAHVP